MVTLVCSLEIISYCIHISLIICDLFRIHVIPRGDFFFTLLLLFTMWQWKHSPPHSGFWWHWSKIWGWLWSLGDRRPGSPHPDTGCSLTPPPGPAKHSSTPMEGQIKGFSAFHPLTYSTHGVQTIHSQQTINWLFFLCLYNTGFMIKAPALQRGEVGSSISLLNCS